MSLSRYSLLVFLVAAVATPVTGCGSDDDTPRTNRIPVVSLSGSPPDGRDTYYEVRLSWTGSDPDGSIIRYEYAVDPPAAFSEDEIANGGPEITTTYIVPEGDDPGMTLVSKMVNGKPVTFSWIHTREQTKLCVFSAENQDGSDPAGSRFRGMHAFYVRAVDNADAFSEPDRVAFTSVTLAPSSKLLYPTELLSQLGVNVTFSVTGTDPDGFRAGYAPHHYIYKVVKLATHGINVFQALDRGADSLFTGLDDGPWLPLPPGETRLATTFPELGSYGIAFRAVDVAGAVEPFLEFTRNAAVFITNTEAGNPQIQVVDANGLLPQEFSWAVGIDMNLTITCVAATEDGACDVRWNLGGKGDWSEWGVPGPIPSFTLPGGPTALVVEARDPNGNTASTSYVLQGIDMPMDRELLIVDDFRDTVWPRDEEHDTFWLDLATNSGRLTELDLKPEVIKYDSHGENDVFYTFPNPPKLELLGRYKMVFWNVRGAGYNGNTSLALSGPTRRHLDAYLSAGGKWWLSGESSVAALMPTPTGQSSFEYPKEITSADYPWRWLKLFSGDVRNDNYAESDRHGMLSVEPFPDGSGVWPRMEVDKEKMRPFLRERFGVGGIDAVFDPLFTSSDPDFVGQLDSLYVLGAVADLQNGGGSVYHNKLVGIRWHDPDPEPVHGATVWFGFPMYYFNDAEAQVVFDGVLDWFREQPTGGS